VIGLIDYGAGNLRSVQNALERLNAPVQVVDRPHALRAASAIIFPGVGAAGPAMARLEQAGMREAIRDAIAAGVPYLGICLGLQLLFDRSDEDDARGLGVLSGTVERLQTLEKVPHVGWNTVEVRRPHPVLSGLAGEAFYFVHSYVAVPRAAATIVGETDHCGRFASVVAESRVVGTQFHPERSGRAGLRFLANFLALANTGETIHAVQADHSLP
jgi:imidazole glycerol phosphate synthase glutamine amidotransferase subunit